MNCVTDNIKGTGLGHCMPHISLVTPTQLQIDIWYSKLKHLNQTDLNHKIKSVSEVIKKQSLRKLF
ncbi:MAG: hypothetical protein CMC76_12065 [Flavobacteriaceae bacterium]|nr:hypothetical protein [Flavobacteriaceae bacterium]|tara:strand:- start:1 stop:198 length:198 start_codon:yes stop_codon:yes gene_type:complete